MQKTAIRLRLDLLEMFGCDGMRTGHWGGSSSLCEIMTVLYWYKMKNDPSDPEWADRDYLIMSKGHSVPAQYAALCERGYFPREELARFKFFGTMLSGHPEMDRTPGVEANTGSLGQGLSVSVGMALAAKLDDDPGRIFTLMGDGEIQEGQIWEAAMAAVHYGLSNMTAVVDWNGLQIDGRNEDVMTVAPIGKKFEGFGWNVLECDGHDMAALKDAFAKADEEKERPTVIIAKTVKGKGVSFMEDQAGWHGKAPNDEQLAQALKDLGGEE